MKQVNSLAKSYQNVNIAIFTFFPASEGTERTAPWYPVFIAQLGDVFANIQREA